MGRLEMPVRPRRRSGASLLALRGTGIRSEGVLRRTEPPVRAGEELSGRDALDGPVGHAFTLLVACVVSASGKGQRGAVSGRGQRRTEDGLVHRARACRADRKPGAALAAEAGDSPAGARYTSGLSPAAARTR